MKKIISLTFVLIALLFILNAAAYEYPGGMHPAKQIVFVKQQIRKQSRPLCYPKHHFAWSFPTLMPSKLNFNK